MGRRVKAKANTKQTKHTGPSQEHTELLPSFFNTVHASDGTAAPLGSNYMVAIERGSTVLNFSTTISQVFNQTKQEAEIEIKRNDLDGITSALLEVTLTNTDDTVSWPVEVAGLFSQISTGLNGGDFRTFIKGLELRWWYFLIANKDPELSAILHGYKYSTGNDPGDRMNFWTNRSQVSHFVAQDNYGEGNLANIDASDVPQPFANNYIKTNDPMVIPPLTSKTIYIELSFLDLFHPSIFLPVINNSTAPRIKFESETSALRVANSAYSIANANLFTSDVLANFNITNMKMRISGTRVKEERTRSHLASQKMDFSFPYLVPSRSYANRTVTTDEKQTSIELSTVIGDCPFIIMFVQKDSEKTVIGGLEKFVGTESYTQYTGGGSTIDSPDLPGILFVECLDRFYPPGKNYWSKIGRNTGFYMTYNPGTSGVVVATTGKARVQTWVPEQDVKADVRMLPIVHTTNPYMDAIHATNNGSMRYSGKELIEFVPKKSYDGTSLNAVPCTITFLYFRRAVVKCIDGVFSYHEDSRTV